MRLKMLLVVLLLVAALCEFPATQWGAPAKPAAKPARYILDSALSYTAQGSCPAKLRDPAALADWGFNGQVIASVQGLQTFDSVDPSLLSKDGPERPWMAKRAADIDKQIAAAHRAGIKCYSPMDLIVFPTAVVKRYESEICDDKGRIDALKPKTQELLRAMLNEIFDRFSDLDGLIIRTGEVYLTDYPYHSATGGDGTDKTLGSSAIIHGPDSHVQLITILRDEVCVRRDKMVFYRTWDFGHFHTDPAYYLKVTNAIPPHANLIFSIKHQQGDFQQLTPFNPTLMIGKHRQIIEVQCQREAYGKGAHPYYIGQGVIDGWEEYQWMSKPGEPKGLRDVINNPLCAGVWTWSRGGGWEGPYIPSEFWCLLNTYVVAKYAEDPTRSEEDIFDEYSRKIGLSGDDIAKFRQLNLLSAKAVLRGQLTTLGAKIDLWWARDHFLEAPDLSDFVKKGLVGQALDEKAEAVSMWGQIESLSKQIHFPDSKTSDFVVTSCTYGRLKYSIIQQAWTILFFGGAGDASGNYDQKNLAKAIAAYDQLWEQWRALKAGDPTHCSSIYEDKGFKGKPGIGAAVDHYRAVLAIPATRP